MPGWLGRYASRELKFRKKSQSLNFTNKEHYLREDIRCGSHFCKKCPYSNRVMAESEINHYLVADSKVIFEFLEVFELKGFAGLICLVSVLDDIREQGTQRALNRVKSLYSDERRGNVYFDDTHFLHTHLMLQDRIQELNSVKGSEITLVEKKREAVYVAASWYSNHLDKQVPIVVLIDEDPSGKSNENSSEWDNLVQNFSLKLKLDSDGVQFLTPKQYFRKYWGTEAGVMDLFETISAAREEMTSGGTDSLLKTTGSIFEDYLSVTEVEDGVANGTIRIGTFQVSSQDRNTAFVRPTKKSGAMWRILLQTRADQNRAIAGDTVAVQIQSESTKTNPDPLPEPNPTFPEEPDLSQLPAASETGKDLPILCGKVVRIINRPIREVVACLREDEEAKAAQPGNRSESFLCVPLDRNLPLVRVRTRHPQRLAGTRFVVGLSARWPRSSLLPEGHVLRVIGPMGNLQVDCQAVLDRHSVQGREGFPAGTLRGLPDAYSWKVPAEELAQRRDLRVDHFTCSVDPPTTTDVDDALSTHTLQNGLIQVGVHIADVSFFLPAGSQLDLEARSRGTTVYLVDSRIDMLPAVLSENVCSLLGGTDRLAMSVIWTVDPRRDFSVVDTWHGCSVVHNSHQLSYEQAQAILERGRLPAALSAVKGDQLQLGRVKQHLEILTAVAQRWRENRRREGAVDLESTEFKFETDQAKQPVKLISASHFQVNSVIAELMIAANSSVAQKIYNHFPSFSLLRRHSPPQTDSFKMLSELCAARGFLLDTSSNKALAESLESLPAQSDSLLQASVKSLATRAMSEAEYICTGVPQEPSGFYHYGLALQFYTHFTSPIRRYADVVVHRLLMSALDDKLKASLPARLSSVLGARSVPGSFTAASPEDLQKLSEHLNDRHRASKQSQKDISLLYLLHFLSRSPQVAAATIISIGSSPPSISVFVPKFDLTRVIKLQSADGKVMLPKRTDEDSLDQSADVYLDLTDPGCVKIRRARGESAEKRPVLFEFKILGPVFLRLSANDSRAHGLTLKTELLAREHPMAVSAVQQDRISAQKWQPIAVQEQQRVSQESDNKVGLSQLVKVKSGQVRSGAVQSLSVSEVLSTFREEGMKETSLFSDATAEHILVACQLKPVKNGGEEWLKLLMKASKLRLKIIKSCLPEDHPLQQQRKRKESQIRMKAGLIF